MSTYICYYVCCVVCFGEPLAKLVVFKKTGFNPLTTDDECTRH